MNKKGQALVEFVIITPILIFILLAIVDYGTMSYNKYRLENIMNDVSSMYKNKETNEEINKFIDSNDNNVSLSVNEEEKFFNIKLSKKYDCITPGLDKVLNNHDIVVERKVYYE